MVSASIKFLPVESVIEAMSKHELYEFRGDKKFWPLHIEHDGKTWSVCSVHFSHGGAQKAANKLLNNYPGSSFIAFGSGWETSVALYVYPPIESMTESILQKRQQP